MVYKVIHVFMLNKSLRTFGEPDFMPLGYSGPRPLMNPLLPGVLE